ncbi:DsrE family protein [Alteromonas lipolytica]|uniref:Uncharacterized protein n=1 Tax=Alteromonas lipolytica TaxID=1856405 RepID=A0A1E8FH16_9ALTE|nr:DsrE family protein [Alteromonas lipolytica]OFI35247.1 hypothetical protein BFC17_17075 [Alteromonas lipolytica]GGF57961.1 protein TusC [Alteromonas lipolytica]
MATITVILTQPPYSTKAAAEGLEFALASTNYGLECQVVFSGAGVFQLLANQQPEGLKNQLKQAKVLPFYDIEPVYVCQASLTAHALTIDDLGIESEDIQLLSPIELHELLSQADHTVTF